MAYQQDRNFAYQPPPAGYPQQGYPAPAPAPYPPQPYQQGGYPPQQYQQQPPPQNYQGYPPPQGNYAPPPQNYPQPYPPQGPPQGYPQGYPQPFHPGQFPPPRSHSGFPPSHYPPGPPPGQHPPPHPNQQPSYLHPAPPPIFHTSPPIAPPIIPTADIDTIYKACKGLGTDERALISVLAFRDGPVIDAIRSQYSSRTQRDLIATLEKETSGHFRTALKAAAFGPVESEVFFVNLAIAGVGTKEAILTEAIMGKTNSEIHTMKTLYPQRYRETLENAVKGDLSMKTEKLFMMALSGMKMDDWVPINPQAVTNDVVALQTATKGFGTDELAVCSVFTRSSDAHLRAVASEYQRNYSIEITRMIRKEFSGHMQDALLYIMDGALNKPARDAKLLEESMKGLGTKDNLLITRLVRVHWNRPHFEAVKHAYRQMYGKDLAARVRGETSGDYGRMMVALCS